MYMMRFDLRAPGKSAEERAALYRTAIDMAAWADELGCVTIAVSEHHGSPDGYLPSPLTMLGAMVARTRNVRFTVAALIAPFWDPLRLAEDLIVLDHLSRGRRRRAEDHGRPGPLHRTGRDPHGAALVGERLAGETLDERGRLRLEGVRP